MPAAVKPLSGHSLKIDLHSHTLCSDGRLSPEELVTRAHSVQLDVLAITDHDCIDAIAPALRFQQGQSRALHIVPGVELSCRWHGFDIHILGLNIDYCCPQFLARLAEQARVRAQRAERICQKLSKAGVDNVFADAERLAGKSQLTRTHIARVLLERGLVSHMQGAFDKYLGKGKRAFVSPEWISIEQAVSWIQQAGGQAVLAHPGHYDLSAKWLRRLVDEFTVAGGEAMELTQGQLASQKYALLVEICQQQGLLASTGSDFHHPGRWRELGRQLHLPEGITPIWHNWQLPSVAA